MGVGCQRHAPDALPPGKRTGTLSTGGWVCPRVGLEGCAKSRPPPGFNPRTAQHVVSRHTDRGTPADPVTCTALCLRFNQQQIELSAVYRKE
jgi:hypothetical protein